MKRTTQKIRGVIEKPKGSGKFYAQWFDAEGRRRSEFGGTQQLAEAIYQKRKTEIREGKVFPVLLQRKITFGDLCDDFMRAKPRHWSLGRAGTRGNKLERLREWFGTVNAAALGVQQISEKFNALRDKGRSVATVNRYRAIGSAIYSWAVRNKRTESNPFKQFPAEREFNQRIRFLNQYEPKGEQSTEETRLRMAIREIAPDREPELDLALATGMRKGEQYSLLWRHLDFANCTLHLGKTKSGHPRNIPLTPEAIAALEELRKSGRSDLVCTPIVRRDGRAQFGDPRQWFEKAVEKAAIPDFHWHDLRHTFASRLVMAGANLKSVRDLMGHETMTMTLRYAHLAPGHLRDTINLLSQYTAAPLLKVEHKPRKRTA